MKFRTARTANTRVPGWARFCPAIAVGILTSLSVNAQTAEPVSPTTTNSAMDAGVDLVKERMEEIIVYASRGKNDATENALLQVRKQASYCTSAKVLRVSVVSQRIRELHEEQGIEYVVLTRTPKEGLTKRSSTDLRGF